MTHSIDTPSLPAKPPLPRHLRAQLEETLNDDYSTLPDGVMVEQARILDRAFRHLVLRGVEYGGTEHFHAAFKAQNQYRMTVNALESFHSPVKDSKKT